MDAIQEKAREVGRLLVQTEEFKALKRANERLSDDRETVTLLNQLSSLEGQLASTLQAGREPTSEQQSEYEGILERLQQRAVYQQAVSAQSNFERLMMRVNEEIAKGIEAGEQSRLILP